MSTIFSQNAVFTVDFKHELRVASAIGLPKKKRNLRGIIEIMEI